MNRKIGFKTDLKIRGQQEGLLGNARREKKIKAEDTARRKEKVVI
jgi:hypothetical protein